MKLWKKNELSAAFSLVTQLKYLNLMSELDFQKRYVKIFSKNLQWLPKKTHQNFLKLKIARIKSI